MVRRYFKTPVEDLEELVRSNLNRKQVLGEIRDELTFRTTDRARQLLKEVEGVLRGDVPTRPEAPRPSHPDDQKELF
jgi:hypothetical protein